jgi:hypothetical protein
MSTSGKPSVTDALESVFDYASHLNPTKVTLLDLGDERVRLARPVTSLDIYDGLTTNFHDEGLFSTSIFGRVGSEERDRSGSYINLKLPILAPKIFEDFVRLRGLYGDILAGKATAVFNREIMDFEASNASEAETGYSFMMRHWHEIKLRRSKSPSRGDRVGLIEKYRNVATTTRAYVIAAGLRDVEIGKDGRTTKHEVNDLYYRLISIANTIPDHVDPESKAYDLLRYQLTTTYYNIYKMFETFVGQGKNSFLLAKVGSHTVTWGTRNVLSVMNPSTANFKAPNAPSFDSIVVGLYQLAKAITPITIYMLRETFINNIFPDQEGTAKLINPKTLKVTYVDVSSNIRDKWTTKDGLVSVLNDYANHEVRHKPIMIADHYAALIYRGNDESFKIVWDIDDVPEHIDRALVTPITFCEFVYLAGYSKWNYYIAQMVRYPVAGPGSVYPARIYVKTTSVGEIRYQLDDNWEINKEAIALEFPRRDIPSFFNTQSPHSSRLGALAADFDGDTGSLTVFMTDDAIAEADRYLRSPQAWVGIDGSMLAPVSYASLELLLNNLTRRRRPYDKFRTRAS